MVGHLKRYELAKSKAKLQNEHNSEQHLLRMKANLEIRNAIGECFKVLDEIAAIPSSVTDNIVKSGRVKNKPFIVIDREHSRYLEQLQERTAKLFAQPQNTQVEFPGNLEIAVDNLRIQLEDQKEQVGVFQGLEKHFDMLLDSARKEGKGKTSVCESGYSIS